MPARHHSRGTTPHFFALACALALPLSGQQVAGPTPAIPDYHTDRRFLAEVEAARSPGQIPETAIRHWQAANAVAGHHCPECFEHIATLSFRAGKWQDAADAAAQAERFEDQPTDLAYVELLRGSALMRVNDDHPALLDLDTADQSLKAAFSHDPHLHTALFLDGRALAALHRDADARAAFEHFLAAAPADDRYRSRAEQYLRDLHLARTTMAPPFSVTTVDGKTVTLDSLRGRVVLLDFWATWCVPCKQYLPQLQKLNADLHDQPFTILSVSRDEDLEVWKQYIADNHMTWPQVLDTGHTLASLYGVDALPHTFTIDADGALQSEIIGVGEDDLETRIRALLRRAHAIPPGAQSPGAPSVGSPASALPSAAHP